MKLSSVKIYQYALLLAKPLIVKSTQLHERTGLILHLQAEQNYEGFGEIAPLEGYSKETLAEAMDQIQRLKPFLEKEDLPDNIFKLDGSFYEWLQGFQPVSSVQCGIEMAVLNLSSDILNKPLYKLLSDVFHEQIGISGLLQGSKNEIVNQAKTLMDNGYTSLKMKVGDDIQADIEKVIAVTSVTEQRALLHVDANRKWSFNDAIAFGNEVGLAAVEYIEEPFKETEQISDFFMKTTIPAALDETLMERNFEDVKSIEGIDFIVLKPTAIGGIEKTWQLINRAKQLALNPVISSSFESGVGILALANLAGATARDYSTGLDTLKWFEDDLLLNPLKIENGKLNIKDRQLHSNDILLDRLKEL